MGRAAHGVGGLAGVQVEEVTWGSVGADRSDCSRRKWILGVGDRKPVTNLLFDLGPMFATGLKWTVIPVKSFPLC